MTMEVTITIPLTITISVGQPLQTVPPEQVTVLTEPRKTHVVPSAATVLRPTVLEEDKS